MAVSAVDLFGKLFLDDKAFQSDVEKSASKAGDKVGQTLGAKVNTGLRQSLTAGLASPSGVLAKIAGQGGLLQRGFSGAKNAVGAFGNALGNAKNRLVGLLTGPLGLLGLTGGLLSIAGLFKSGIDKAREFGGEVGRIRDLTGLSAEAASKLAGVFDHFGVSADTVASVLGKVGKNLEAITATSAKGATSSTKLASAEDAVRKAEERLHVARLKLVELESRGHVTASALATARNRVADATRALSIAEGKLAGAHKIAAAGSSGAAAFERKYGISVVDSHGKVLDFYNLLLTTADYWAKKGIPINTKITALQKIYGKSWQDFLPVIKAGRAGIQGAAEEAAKLGLTLSADNLSALAKLKEATRTWTDALGGLKLQLGLLVIPLITDFAKGLTTLVVDNRVRIVAFFKSIIDAGQRLAGIFATTLWPILQSVFSILQTAGSGTGGLSFATMLEDSANFARDLAKVLNSFVVPAIKGIVDGWNALPAQLRELLIKGFIANKVVKWTFGFDAIGFGKQLAGTFISNVAGKLTATIAGEGVVGALEKAGIGKAFVQPVFVTNPGFGAAGAAEGAAGAAEGAAGIGLAGLAAIAASILGSAVVAAAIINAENSIFGITPADVKAANTHGQFGARTAGQGAAVARTKPAEPPLGEHALDREVDATNRANALLGASLTQGHRDMDKLEGTVVGAAQTVKRPLDALHLDFAKQRAVLEHSLHPQDLAKAATKIAADIVHGVGNLRNTNNVLGQLRHALSIAIRNGDHDAATRIRAAIAKVEAKIPGRVYITHQIALAQKLVSSSKSTHDKIVGLQRIQAALKARGDINASRIVGRLVLAQRAINATTAAVNRTTAAVFAHPVNEGPGAGKAAGGPVSLNSVQPIGEKGPELFVPKVPGVVLPNWLLRSLAGVNAATETVIQNFNVPVDGLVRAETPGDIARILRQVGNSGVLHPRRRLTTFSTRRKLALGDV